MANKNVSLEDDIKRVCFVVNLQKTNHPEGSSLQDILEHFQKYDPNSELSNITHLKMCVRQAISDRKIGEVQGLLKVRKVVQEEPSFKIIQNIKKQSSVEAITNQVCFIIELQKTTHPDGSSYEDILEHVQNFQPKSKLADPTYLKQAVTDAISSGKVEETAGFLKLKEQIEDHPVKTPECSKFPLDELLDILFKMGGDKKYFTMEEISEYISKNLEKSELNDVETLRKTLKDATSLYLLVGFGGETSYKIDSSLIE